MSRLSLEGILLGTPAASLLAAPAAGGGVAAPAAPTGLTATVFSTSRIDLTWTDNATDETGYKVYRSTDNVSFTEIDDIAADSEAYSDTTITAGTTYYYKVAAYNAGGEAAGNVDAANTLTLNLISYWELEETSGQRNDSHGTNHLADNNTVTQAAGKIGNAAQFTGANAERLSIASNASLQTGDIDFELDAWYYHDAAPTGGPGSLIVGKATADTFTGYEYALAVTNTPQIAFVVGNGTTIQSVVATTFGNLSAGNWYHIRSWHDKTGTIGVSVNGTANTAARTVTPAALTNPFLIGGFTTARFTNGRVDEVGFWKRLLTAAERASRYNGGSGRSYSYINPLP